MLCDIAVRWIVKRDRRALFRFAALHSQAARDALTAAGAREPLPDSMVLIDAWKGRPRVLLRSDAAIGIAKRLGFPYALATVAAILPKALRDSAYDAVARNRRRWFGGADACAFPTPELRARLLDEEAGSGTRSSF
jgi:predicted DCC family thiol-disulfide oxidoreductase YuxK